MSTSEKVRMLEQLVEDMGAHATAQMIAEIHDAAGDSCRKVSEIISKYCPLFSELDDVREKLGAPRRVMHLGPDHEFNRDLPKVADVVPYTGPMRCTLIIKPQPDDSHSAGDG